MADTGKARTGVTVSPMGIKVAAVVCLVAAAILWWSFLRQEVTVGGVFAPLLFTVLGIFWLYVGSRAKDPERSGRQTDSRDA